MSHVTDFHQSGEPCTNTGLYEVNCPAHHRKRFWKGETFGMCPSCGPFWRTWTHVEEDSNDLVCKVDGQETDSFSYALYVNYVNRIAKYHLTECSRVSSDPLATRTGGTGHWRHNLGDLKSVFREALADGQGGVKAVVPADCCMQDSTKAKCVGCYQ